MTAGVSVIARDFTSTFAFTSASAFACLLGASACSLADLSGLSDGEGGGGGTSTPASATGTSDAASTGATGSTGTDASSSGGTGGDGGAGAVSSGSSVSASESSSSGAGGSPPCPPGAMCQVVDDFEDGIGLWLQFGDCVMGGSDGKAFIEAIDVSTHYCAFSTAATYDLREQSIHVAVDEVTTDQIGSQTYLAVETPDGDVSIAISKSGSAFQVENGPEATYIIDTDYEPAAARFWRIAGEGDELVFSIHGALPSDVWVEVFRTSDGVPDLSAMRAVIGLGTYATVADAGRGVFDCVNVDPASCP